jgi:hypothetical protein
MTGYFKLLIVLIVVLLAFASQVEARLGETMEQCEKRYGKPTSSEEFGGIQGLAFKKNDFTIRVFIINGKCGMISYEKEGELINKPLSKEEIEKFLSSNSQDFEWEVKDTMGEAYSTSDELLMQDLMRDAMKCIRWRRRDGAIAFYNKLESQLVFTTKKALEIGSKNEKDSLDGF